jgi:RimJ/RimL family protein N-acetyltransferase/GNAT superfamily N-acetyltransferase
LNRGVFTPIRTDRLLIRAATADDTEGLYQRRNDPVVAKYQNWALPFPRERAEEIVRESAAMEGPINDEWWMPMVVASDSGEVVGDLAVHLTWQGRTAEVGYTFGSAHWGHGYAVEAVEALVEYLFEEVGVTRIFGMLHPENPASAMVLERTGFLFEGHTKNSFWLAEENSDDWIYGLNRSDWDAWRKRPLSPPERVELIEINPHNVQQVRGLATHKTQERFVATMNASFADALVPEIVDGYPAVPWMRAVTADDEIVGFVMLALAHEHFAEPYLWRLLIDRMHQRRGIGGRALELIYQECRGRGATALFTSWGEGKGSPEPFYRSHGFEPTGGLVDDHEIEARRLLD